MTLCILWTKHVYNALTAEERYTKGEIVTDSSTLQHRKSQLSSIYFHEITCEVLGQGLLVSKPLQSSGELNRKLTRVLLPHIKPMNPRPILCECFFFSSLVVSKVMHQQGSALITLILTRCSAFIARLSTGLTPECMYVLLNALQKKSI